MTTPAPVASFRRLRLGFGIATTVLAGAAGVMVLVSASLPSPSFDLALLGLALGGLAVVAWLVAGTLAVVARRFSAALLVMPVLLALVLVATGADLPLRMRFAAARPAFENAVAARGEAGPDAPCPERIGGYRILRCLTTGSVTLFYEADGGFLDSTGFAYAPDGVAESTPGDAIRFTLLSGPWYTFSQSW